VPGFDSGQVNSHPEAAIVSIFGPDFRERPGIAGTMFDALAAEEINILAISTSISTVSCVIESAALEAALNSLRKTFDLP
jgi:aspartokinase